MIVTSDQYKLFIEASSGVTIPASGLALLATVAPWVQARIEKIIGYKLPAAQTSITEYYPESVANNATSSDYMIADWDLVNGRMQSQMRDYQSRRILNLRNLPVRSITSVYENVGAWETAGGDFPSTSLLETNDYYLDALVAGISHTGRLIRNHGIWTRQPRCIKITYVYGLTQAEIDADYGDLKGLVCRSIQAFYIGTILRSRAGDSGGVVTSTGITDFSVSFADPAALGLFFQNNFMLPPDVLSDLQPYINLRRYF